MGKINEYQRKTLASTVVGVASADKSGQIVGGATQKFGASVVTHAQKMDQYDTIQANSSVMQFGLAFQRLGTQTQLEMAGNPGGYEDRLMDTGTELLNSYASAIEDPGVRGKFLGAGQTILKAGVFAGREWSVAKKIDNAQIGAKESIRIGTVMTGQAINVDQLKESIATVEEEALTELPPEVMAGVDSQEFLKKNMPGVVASYFTQQAYGNPEQLIPEIKDKKYKDIKYYTQAMGDKYTNAARARIKQIKSEIKKAQKDNAAEFTMQWVAGTLSMAKVNAAWTARESDPMKSISTDAKNSFETGLINRMNTEAGKTKTAYPNSERYINLIYNSFDNRVDQAEALKSVIDIYADGWEDPDELVFLSQLKANLQESQTARKADGVFKGVETISNKTYRLWTERGGRGKDSIEEKRARYFKHLVDQTREGVPADTATRNVLNQMDHDKVVEDNPTLANSEDPVGAAYEKAAYEYLKVKGLSTEDKYVKNVAQQIRASEKE